MSIQAVIPLNVDFCNQKYILVNAKQYDKNARYLLITCYNGGELFSLSSKQHSAFVRYKKPDGYSVFNKCEIQREGKVLVELTEQMLAVQGTCVADLVVVSGGNANVNANGQITGISDGSVISTMIFHINVKEIPVENSELESSYDHSGFNEALEEVTADFSNVVRMARSWAEGGTGLRTGEDENNAKYWADIAFQNATGDLGDKLVTGIKGNNETTYRKGQVNITAYNVGAVPTTDIATVSEVTEYLGI